MLLTEEILYICIKIQNSVITYKFESHRHNEHKESKVESSYKPYVKCFVIAGILKMEDRYFHSVMIDSCLQMFCVHLSQTRYWLMFYDYVLQDM